MFSGMDSHFPHQISGGGSARASRPALDAPRLSADRGGISRRTSKKNEDTPVFVPHHPLKSSVNQPLPIVATKPYGFSFTAASLRPELLLIVAERFLQTSSWEKTKESVLAANELQCRTATSAQRMERELRSRLQTLSHRQLELLVESGADIRISLAWLAAVKHSCFLFDFAADALRPKIEQHDHVLRESDYRRFIEGKMPSHPELMKLSESTSGKVRRVLFAMLREAGILSKGDGIGSIQRPVIPLDVEISIRSENPAWLAAYLVPGSEIQKH